MKKPGEDGRKKIKVENKIFIDQSWGQKAKYFDMASVTKIMATTPLCMKLYEEKSLNLDKTVGHYLNWLDHMSIGKIKVRD